MTDTAVPVWTFGERMRKARETAGLDRETMAERIGVSPEAIRKWEYDRAKPRDVLEIARKWAEVTGVPDAWLLGVNLGWISLKRRRQRKTESFPSRAPPDAGAFTQTG